MSDKENQVEPAFMCFPGHKASMTITHNDHKSYYQSAEDWIKEESMYDWDSEEEKARAIELDSIWTVQWYPRTPNTFYSVAASTLEAALIFAGKYE